MQQCKQQRVCSPLGTGTLVGSAGGRSGQQPAGTEPVVSWMQPEQPWPHLNFGERPAMLCRGSWRLARAAGQGHEHSLPACLPACCSRRWYFPELAELDFLGLDGLN